MVRINGNDFEIYDLDTLESILDRIAVNMNTLPRYLYFPNGKPTLEQFSSNNNIQVIDILAEIRRALRNNINFKNFYKDNEEKIEGNNLDILSDIFLPYITFYITENKIQDYYLSLAIEGEMEESIKEGILPSFLTSEQVIEKVGIIERNIINEINKLRRINEERIDFFQSLEIIEGIPSTNFELEKTKFNLVLNITDISLLEIFNNLRLNIDVPFATIKSFYKIFKDFVPPDPEDPEVADEDWTFSIEDAIILKISEKINSLNIKKTEYSEALIGYKDEDMKEIAVSLNLSVSGTNLTQQQYERRFLNTLSSLDIDVKYREEDEVNGVFYFPNHQLNNYVISDLIMNDPLFYSMLSIDESKKSTKQKSSLYFYFNNKKIGKIHAVLTEKIMNESDGTMRNKSRDIFPLNQYYIRVKISRAPNIEAVKEFREILGKLLAVYDQKYSEIVNIYREYIPDFAEPKVIEVKEKEKKTLRAIAPEIFVSGYTRKCPKFPTIISDEEAKEARENNKQVMVFPKEDDISPQRNYICNYKNFPYPGLRNNPLSNSESYPYIPCCYEKDQMNRKGSKYRHYFYGEQLATTENEQQNLITTNKFVQFDNFGTLPSNITKMFEIVEPNPRYMYVRKGVHRTKNSFLECIMEAINDQNITSLKDDERRIIEIVDNTRRSFATEELAAVCKQELYNYSIDEIMNLIRNTEVYFDPKLFVHLLEVVYNVNIYIFTRNNINGELTIPKHLQSYYRYKNTNKSIFIFEHIGSESDYAEYLQCELIVKWKKGSEDITDIFPSNTKIKNIFQQLSKTYSLTETVPEIIFPWPINTIIILSQKIDSYGKTRALNFSYKNNTYTIITSPIPPLYALESTEKRIYKMSRNIVLDFASEVGIIVLKQNIIEGKLVEVHGKLGNVKVIIPIDSTENILEAVPVTTEPLNFPKNIKSELTNYNKMKKLSRYITEYVFWLYSKYIDSNNLEMDIESVKSFEMNILEVDNDFQYTNISKTFSMNSSVIRNGKLVINSEDTLKRLLYVLRIEIIRNPGKIKMYHSRNVIEEYFKDITDFDHYSYQVILEGEFSVQKWIEEKKSNYFLFDSVQPFLTTPYFFKNKLIGNKIYLAQNTSNINQAISISLIWQNDNYNAISPPFSDFVKFKLYSYQNKNNIKPYIIKGNDTNIKIEIIGYKIIIEDDTTEGVSEEIPNYTVLLPLS